MATLDSASAHREAGIAAAFQWQDAGTPASVDYTTVLGTLTDEQGRLHYIVAVEGTADSGHGYSYPVSTHLSISHNPDDEVTIDDATDEGLKAVGVKS